MRMERWLVALFVLLILAACNPDSAKEQVEEKPTNEVNEKDNTEDDNNSEQEITETTEETTETIEDNEDTSSEEHPQEGEEGVSVYVDFEPYTESFSVNGIVVGDTKEHVIEMLGEPDKKYDGDVRFDYTFQDAWFGETLSFDLDDLGVNYIQADTITEKGKLIEEAFMESYDQDINGQIYKAKDQMLKDFDETAIAMFVYFVHEDSILVLLKSSDEQYDVKRSYMVTHIDHWTWARGWDMEMFKDESLFTKVDADTAIAEQ